MQVLGTELFPNSSFWNTLGNCPGEALFADYQRGQSFVWTNASGISRDVQLLFWRAADQRIASLWRLKLIRCEDETTRFLLSEEAKGLAGYETDIAGEVRGPDTAWVWSNVERQAQPRRETVRKIAHALGVSIDEAMQAAGYDVGMLADVHAELATIWHRIPRERQARFLRAVRSML